MAPVATFGPFLDDHGLKIWFDLYQPIRLVSFYLAGVAAPVLRAPVRGLLLNGRQSYRIEAGSVWIASDLIARVPALQGYYTGLTVRGGSLDLSVAATMSGTDVLRAAAADAVLHLDLDQPAPARIAQDAGGDAIASSVQLPATFDLRFQIHASSLKAGAAAATAFGCTVRFVPSAQPPIWAALVSQILVPYQATTNTQTPDRFEVATSTSALCTVNGSAQIDSSGTGWLLPAAKLDPLTVGAAAGIGAMSIALTRGISATWCMLYAQVLQADGKQFRNILLAETRFDLIVRQHADVGGFLATRSGLDVKSFNSLSVNLDAPATGASTWTDLEIQQLLADFHLDADTPLSILAVEMMPRYDQYIAFAQASDADIHPLSRELGQYRILRTSPLVAAPDVCCEMCAARIAEGSPLDSQQMRHGRQRFGVARVHLDARARA